MKFKVIALSYFLIIIACLTVNAQTYSISGRITDAEHGAPVEYGIVALKNTMLHTTTGERGHYKIKNVQQGTYILTIKYPGFKEYTKEVTVKDEDLSVDMKLEIDPVEMQTVEVKEEKDNSFGITRLKDVEGTAIYAGKKTEVVVLADLTANTATNNARQVYSKVAGLNIWENDGAGIQLGIGGRGLNPNRVSNFNTRQNGYDMSADALGYPESYYTPPTESLERIEIVRGAASLQYGTQFGGMVNFKLKKGPEDKKIEATTRLTGGSWGFLNSFTSVGGTVKKVNYYAFYQHKQGDGWRANGQFNVNTAYASANYNVTKNITIGVEYTYMDYLAHQSGGLTQSLFDKNPQQSIRTRNWFKVNWNLAAVTADYKISNHLKLNTRFFGLIASRDALGNLDLITRTDDVTQDRNLLIDHYKNWGNETRLLYTYNLGKTAHNLVVGFRYYSGHTDRQQGLGNSNSTGYKSDFVLTNPSDPEYSKYTFPNHNVAVFAENIFRLSSKLSIIPGIRFENIVTRANGYYTNFGSNQVGTILNSKLINENRINNRSFVLGGVGLSYQHNDNLHLYANISQNYRGINFNDMRITNPNQRVDPNLKDESGYSADMGVKGNLKNILNYDISVFQIFYKNRIGSVNKTDTVSFNDYRYRTNISDSRNIGFESFAELDIWRLIKKDAAKMKISIFSNFTMLDARYIHSQEAAFQNKKVELVPNIIFKSGLTFKKNKVAVTYQFSYTGQQFTDATNAIHTPDEVNGIIPAYYVNDLSAEYTINKIFSVSGSINNLTNNMYFTRRADSYPGPGIIPSDARSFYLTLQVKL